jgi:hypothetical protein
VKRHLIAVAVLMSWSIFTLAGQMTKFFVVRVRDLDRKTTFETMTVEAFKKLDYECKEEAKLFPEALAIVEKEWKKDEVARQNPFPASMLAARQVDAISPALDEVKIADRLVRARQQEIVNTKEEEA